ncbi:RNA recognition motif domain-containing protein [Phthorimaea operculella]|nr:RNA recognition motif domain-containing protein [Phthorimaea operculella]
MATEQLPKEFEKTTEVLPFSKYGISSYEDIKKAEEEVQHLEHLKKLGLSNEEIKLYQDNEAGLLDEHKKVESSVLKAQLESVYNKVNAQQNEPGSSKQSEESSSKPFDLFARLEKKTITFYPEGHPMNEIKELEQSMFAHLKNDIIPITKRRKMLRRLERRKERILAQEKQLIPTLEHTSDVPRRNSLWDVKEKPSKPQNIGKQKPIIGPKQETLYTIKDNKIVRLEPVNKAESKEDCIEQQENPEEQRNVNINQEYRAVDIVIPVNAAEEQLLEGTKMCVDDIKKIERFKDYEPGVPSKVLYLKNIASSVTQEQLSMLFIQFQLENGGPVDVRLMSGRMRGQAFVSFQNEDLAIRALDEVNGTILSGKPVVIQFGRNSNRIQDDNR